MPVSNENSNVVEHIGLTETPPVYRSKFLKKQTEQVEKRMIQNLFGFIESGSFKVVFWDGTEEQYGLGTPMFKLIIRDESIIGQLVKKPTLAFCEAYVDGLIDFEGEIEDVVKLIHLNKNLIEKFNLLKTGQKFASKFYKSSVQRQKKNIEHHYDLGNDFFALWLDPTMSYSCAYFHTPQDTLEQAQLQKIDHTLKKLRLKSGEKLLDIGSGWGWLIIRATQQYGVKATVLLSAKNSAKRLKNASRNSDLVTLWMLS